MHECKGLQLHVSSYTEQKLSKVIKSQIKALKIKTLNIEHIYVIVYSIWLHHDWWVMEMVPRQFVYGHFVYDTSSTDTSSTVISSTTVYQRVGQLYIQLLFQQIIIFINSTFYLHYDSFLLIPLPLTL